MELPAIPAAPDPASALRSEGIPSANPSVDNDEEVEGEGEYEQPRSLADRLGDWLEYRIDLGRSRMEGDSAFREAEIARKVALLESETERETGLLNAQSKLRQARVKAQADRTAARGKSDTSAAGFGSDKGRGKGSSGGSGGGRSSGAGGGTGRGPGGGRGTGSGGSRGAGGGRDSKGSGKGLDRSAGGRKNGAANQQSGGSGKGRQNRTDGAGSPGKGRRNGQDGPGRKAPRKGDSKDHDGKNRKSPAADAPSGRSRGRQERAAARQAARQQRRSADQAARIDDRSKDRDQARADKQAARDQRRERKAERKAARKEKRAQRAAAEHAGPDRTTLGTAVADTARERWDKRRAETEKAKNDKAGKEDKPKSGGAAPDETKGDPKDKGKPESGSGEWTEDDADQLRQRIAEERARRTEAAKGDTDDKKDASDGAAPDAGEAKPSTAKDTPKKGGPAKGGPDGDGWDDDWSEADSREFHDRLAWEKARRAAEQEQEKKDWEEALRAEQDSAPGADASAGAWPWPENGTPVFDFPDHPNRPAKHRPQKDDYIHPAPEADPRELPAAPEPHTPRPGTTRPAHQEDRNVSEPATRTPSAAGGMPAQHRTDITFDEYLMEIVNIAIAAGLDGEEAEKLAEALGKVADALRDMATDLVGDHNIATEVTTLISDLADAATRMKLQAERCATECRAASEAATVAAMAVGRTYGEDIQAMDNAGLAHASAAAHHD
ncbi:ATP/GTP-binding protein [Streptomyces umbrinus]|uniref:ATP/GTP-binding protein n=1 Tax=Streptomyces umbrinus TaxID=67370 RepID=UPI0033C8209C